ncbi:MAG: DUF4347 domain-containing protein, partial [Endozoicomonas sp.]
MNAKLIRKISSFFGAGQSDSSLNVETQAQQKGANSSERRSSHQFGMALEPRIMLDAAITATGSEVQEGMEVQGQPVEPQDNQQTEERLLEAFAPLAVGPAREVILVDPSVSDYETLLQDLPAGVDVHILSENATLSEISEVLSGYNNLDAVHLISHGGDGFLSLGGETVTESTLQEQQQTLNTIGQSLSENGDILLYGCNVGESEAGQSFIDLFAALTSADIAASDDLTGVGGDWELEVEEGKVEASVAIAQSAQMAYQFNLAASFTGLNGTPTFTEGGSAVTLDGDATVLDTELDAAGDYDGATLTLSRGGGANADDVFSVTTGGFATITTNAGGTLLLTFNSGSTTANVNSVLQSITYSNSSDNPAGSVQINYRFNDGGGVPEVATGSVNVTITPVNDAPTLTGLGGTLVYSEGDGAQVIDSSITIGDVDDTHIESATIQITGNYLSTEDVLSIDGVDVIAGVTASAFNTATGTLTLTADNPNTITIAQFQTMLEAVKYTNSSDNPNTGNRTVSWAVNDGDVNSTVATSTITVAAVNDAPTLTGDLSANVNEGGDYTILAADLGYTDPDDVDAGITFTTSSPTNGSILVNGTVATTFTGTQLTANQVVFRHDGTETTAASFAVNVEDDDEDGSSPANSTFNFTVTPVNDAPVLDLDGSTAGNDYSTTFTEGGSAVAVADTDVAITDADDTNIESATITLTNNQTGDVMAFGSMPTGIIASVTGHTVTLSGSASLADYQTALQAVTFNNTSGAPNTVDRSITVVLYDGDDNSTTATTTISISATNNAPDLDLDASGSGNNYSTSFTEGGSAVAVADTDVAITDADDTNIESATITLTNNQAGDVMAAGAMPTGITATVVGNTVTLSGSASLADYQTALQAVTFENTSDNPDTTARTITVVVNDGD